MDVNTVNRPPPLDVNEVNRNITVPHLGITLRTLIGAALNAEQDLSPGATREYHVIYKDAVIGSVNVRQHAVTA